MVNSFLIASLLLSKSLSNSAVLNCSQKASLANFKRTTFFSDSYQLFDKDEISNIPNKYVDQTGAEFAYVGSTISHSIPVQANTWYTPSFQSFVVYYNVKRKVIGGELNTRVIPKFFTPSATAYIRLTIPSSLVASFMLNKGQTQLPWEQFTPAPRRGKVIGSQTNASSTGRVDTPPKTLLGKTVWVCGTSIPALGGYYERAAARLGFKLINMAVPSSTARRSKLNGSVQGISYYAAAWNLSSTITEKQIFIDNYTTIKDSLNMAFGGPSRLSKTDKDYILKTSWEYRLKPYIDGTYPMPDLFVFNHNFNDPTPEETNTQFAALPGTPTDRGTYVGAINYLISQIIQKNPRARILLVSHYENQLYPQLAEADQTVTQYWQFPLLKLFELTGWSQRIVPGSRSLWGTGNYRGPRAGESVSSDMTVLRVNIPDGVHPSSDPTGRAQTLLAKLVYLKIEELLRE